MIAVVHLVWGPLGTEPLRRFVASYRRHRAGIEHELVMLLNSVSKQQAAALQTELHDVDHSVLTTAEPVQDLAAYAFAATNLEHERLCFVNSYSEILERDWLAKLDRALDRPRAGLVGATGSWASVRSGALNALFLPNPYRGVVPERKVAREQLQAIELEQRRGTLEAGARERDHDSAPRRSLGRSILATLQTLPGMPEQLLRFEGFPAQHLRTNAFMADRAVLADLRIGRVARKMDAYLLESGRGSLTRQVRQLGLHVLVVSRDGIVYEPDDWPHSRTLWQGDQERLLIADNQTRLYANGGIDRRRLLSAFAWGRQADPSLPGDDRDHDG